MTFFFL